MNAHTPGPWVVIDGRILPVNYSLEGAPLATVHARKKPGMQGANAALIAAAPDLLNALTVLANAAESFGIPVDAARAAITKATTP